ncbi:hypothetical protein [Xanthomonas arboricola]|uniref:hypothetical protein n=1 Tax=Xanthomonas arboricola TaxID=56448 RepID=UPI0011AFD6E9|nr:hypothetical protein [Xanthomonas arboricola]
MDPLPEKEPAESAKSGIAAPPDAEKEVIYSFDESINSRNDNGSEKPSPYGQPQEQKAPGSHRPIMEFDTFFNALELAETSPAAALLLAWSSVEANVIKCARLNGMDLHGKQLTAYSAFLFLEKSGLTSPEMDRRFKELLNLRNKVAHLSLADLPTEVVEQYILMAEDLVGKLPY